MSELCNITQPHYLRALLQLLPTGYAWEWDENSAGRRVLAVVASELHRVHELLCRIANYNIERFAVGNTGWSAPDYERLLLDKFGIRATVTDGLTAFDCESPCDAPLFDERVVYVYLITVDDVSAVPPAVLDYLREYQQSHTHFYLRDNRLTAQTLYDHAAYTCESPCDAPLYLRDWHGVELYADGTCPTHKLNTLPAWPVIAGQLRTYTDIYRGTHAPTQ